MVTFFRVDFLRDEALRRDVASWVNDLGRDTRVRNATDAMVRICAFRLGMSAQQCLRKLPRFASCLVSFRTLAQ